MALRFPAVPPSVAGIRDLRPALARVPRPTLLPPAAGVRRADAGSRVLDLLLAGLLLILLAPLMAVIAVLVRRTSPGPALFRQIRLGRDCRPFVMLKFRTMYVDADDRLHREYVRTLLVEPTAARSGPEGLYKLVEDPRVTPVGRWLRTSSLDELPQLINVLRGEMSLVGPRPVLPWEAALFSPRHRTRFQVRPGITGVWQTSGRNRLTMTQALDLDVEYVNRRSLRLDLLILARTIPVVLRREGVR
jgi:lipopolysaccharide/colanic/teichoic acid biosynthesis glycosyltransferase